MSILIRDMDIPKQCSECRFCEGDTMDGLCYAAAKWFDDEYFSWYLFREDDIDDSKPLNCPLVEVKGRGRMKIERCQNCKYFRDLKHNFKLGQGFERSHACVVWEYCDDSDDSVGWIQEVDPLEAVAIVEKWAAENPIKTNAQKFEEVFGHQIDRYADGMPAVCPPDRARCKEPTDGCADCAKWWDEPYTEPKGEEE